MSRKFIALNLIVMGYLAVVSVAAQPRSEIVVSFEDKQTPEALYKGSHALVIGVSNYTAGWNVLPGVKSDVEAVKSALEKHGFSVSVLQDPTKGAPRSNSISTQAETSMQDVLATKGKALAAEDPLATELRNREPDGPARRGFDIGMGAVGGNTSADPANQSIHDSLSSAEQIGFKNAVAFALERNRNSNLARIGGLIANKDSAVAAERAYLVPGLAWLGFDIATGIFGDPNLGAVGRSRGRPNAQKIRDSLSPEAQNGYDSAQKFHSRNQSQGGTEALTSRVADLVSRRTEEPARREPRSSEPAQSPEDVMAAEGEALANADPLATELRNREPDDSNRRGFDIGMAASEGQTLPGPNKDRMRDSLSARERRGFQNAVDFSLERNRNAVLARKGGAIARRDQAVADARSQLPIGLAWLGFDIATALFGDPNLGGHGRTEWGPNSQAVKDALSPEARQGFEASWQFYQRRKGMR